MNMRDLIDALGGGKKLDAFENITVLPEQQCDRPVGRVKINYPGIAPESSPELGMHDDGQFVSMSRTPYPNIRTFDARTPVLRATQTDQSHSDLTADPATISAP